jgi:voltage-gated potassium channel
MNDPTLGRRLSFIGLFFAAVLAVGTAGYVLIEGWNLTEALYMTVITISTVGFTEVHPLTTGGRWFTTILILVGVGGAAYLFSTVADYIVTGELRGTLEKRRMQKKADLMQDHYIVCGYGRVGKQVVQELQAHGAPVVVIDNDPDKAGLPATIGLTYIVGDASDDTVLRQAGVERARGLIAATGTDAENVFITLSARAIQRNLTIVARGILADAERKLRKAGADHVILPHAIGGRRMAGVLMRPTVVDFLDVVMHSEDLELWLEDIPIRPDCPLANCSVRLAQIRTRTGANVLAIRTVQGQLITHVDPDYVLQAGDFLVALGTRPQLRALSLLATQRGTDADGLVP